MSNTERLKKAERKRVNEANSREGLERQRHTIKASLAVFDAKHRVDRAILLIDLQAVEKKLKEVTDAQ